MPCDVAIRSFCYSWGRIATPACELVRDDMIVDTFRNLTGIFPVGRGIIYFISLHTSSV